MYEGRLTVGNEVRFLDSGPLAQIKSNLYQATLEASSFVYGDTQARALDALLVDICSSTGQTLRKDDWLGLTVEIRHLDKEQTPP